MTETPRYPVRIEHIRIPTRDGTFLAADLVRPDCDGSFPAIIEYLPYRKDDVSLGPSTTRTATSPSAGSSASGSTSAAPGSSEGVNTDEYMPVEQLDGSTRSSGSPSSPGATAGSACSGRRTAGSPAIQVAMHRPPHLKAIVPMYATDDRYTDDCHYTPGGSMRMYYDVGTYGGNMVAMNALPPVPGVPRRRGWAETLEAAAGGERALPARPG